MKEGGASPSPTKDWGATHSFVRASLKVAATRLLVADAGFFGEFGGAPAAAEGFD